MPPKKGSKKVKKIHPEILAHKDSLQDAYEFVGNIDYLKRQAKFGEEVIGRKCLVLFDMGGGSSKVKSEKNRPKRVSKNTPVGLAADRNLKPYAGKVVAYKSELVDEDETNPELYEFEYLHRIAFDDEDEDDDDDAPEWWMDLTELRDMGQLFWQDAAVERIAVVKKEPTPVIDLTTAAAATTTGETEGAAAAAVGTEAGAAGTAAAGATSGTNEAEDAPVAMEPAEPKFEVGQLVFWHLVQPPKPGETPEPMLDPEGRLTELPQPTGIDLIGTVQALPTKANGYRYEISLPGSTSNSTGTIMLPPSAIWAVDAPDKPNKKKRKKTSTTSKRKKPVETGPPWVDSLGIWLISVPAENSSHGSKANRPVSKKSAQMVITKARKLATGKGISYGKWLQNAVDEAEHSRNLTIFYYNQPITLQNFDYETIKSDGEAHELMYGEDTTGGWLYSYTVEKIHMFQQYCKKHSLDFDNLPTRWQDFPGGMEPPKEEKKSPKKKAKTDDGSKKDGGGSKTDGTATATNNGDGSRKEPPSSSPSGNDIRMRTLELPLNRTSQQPTEQAETPTKSRGNTQGSSSSNDISFTPVSRVASKTSRTPAAPAPALAAAAAAPSVATLPTNPYQDLTTATSVLNSYQSNRDQAALMTLAFGAAGAQHQQQQQQQQYSNQYQDPHQSYYGHHQGPYGF